VTREQDLLQLFGSKARHAEALRGLVGGVTATHLRTVVLSGASLDAVIEGLSDPNPRIRWWCVQVLDHVGGARSTAAIARALDDPVARVRRNAAHALGCRACKPGWEIPFSPDVGARLSQIAVADPNDKVRHEARRALSSGGNLVAC
jgi:hypothetical protein